MLFSPCSHIKQASERESESNPVLFTVLLVFLISRKIICFLILTYIYRLQPSSGLDADAVGRHLYVVCCPDVNNAGWDNRGVVVSFGI